MMTEHEPFLQYSKHGSNWKSWDILFYVMLLIPLLLLFIFGQVVILGHPSTSKRILIPFNNHSQSLGFPMTTKGPLPSFSYSALPPCEGIQVKVNTTKNWSSMQQCQFALLQRFFNNVDGILLNFASVLYVCDDTHELSGIQMREFVSYRRPYYVAMPKCQEPLTLITIGIDQDAMAEKQLKETIGNLRIYGTSPTGRTDKIYEKVFPHAVSETSGSVELTTSTGGNDTVINVKSIGFSFYIKELGNQTFFDIIWITTENGPLEYWKFVSKDGIFDKLGLTFCQVGLEVRSDQHKEFYGFMLNVLNNPRYLFTRPTMSVDEKYLRFVLLNVVDERCYRKYAQ